jgi:hypothetical protein
VGGKLSTCLQQRTKQLLYTKDTLTKYLHEQKEQLLQQQQEQQQQQHQQQITSIFQ